MDHNEFKLRLVRLERVMCAIPNWLILETANITRQKYFDDQYFIVSCYNLNEMTKTNMKELNVLYDKYTKVKYGS